MKELIKQCHTEKLKDTQQKAPLNKDDIQFLLKLQQEMNTQDHVCQADPRFWMVRDTKRIYGFDSDYASDYEYVHDTETIGENNKALFEWLQRYIKENGIINNEDNQILAFSYIQGEIMANIIHEDHDIVEELCDTDDVIYALKEHFDIDIQIVYYQDIEFNVPDTLFLTQIDCLQHIQRNHYHYTDKVHPYAMTAWRDPRIEQLYKLLQTKDWSAIKL